MTNLSKGDKAPEFNGLNEKRKPVALSKYKGKKLILFFYPQDNTPTCTIEACNLRDNYKALKKQGYQLLGVSPDSSKKHQNFIDKYQLPFPLIADIDLAIIKSYGVWGPKNTFGRDYEGVYRTTFLIDENGIIEKVFTHVESKRHALQILGE